MSLAETVLWLLFLAVVGGIIFCWLAGLWLMTRGVQQYLLSKPASLYKRLVGRGATLVLLGSLTAEVLALIV